MRNGMLLLKLSVTQGGMFDEASEADMGLHFAKVGDELFDAVALPQRLEAVRPPDPNILRFILELHHPDQWGKHRKIDVPHKSGVLVVGYIAKKP
jgi:hypothetical protein